MFILCSATVLGYHAWWLELERNEVPCIMGFWNLDLIAIRPPFFRPAEYKKVASQVGEGKFQKEWQHKKEKLENKAEENDGEKKEAASA